jgi:hypothetical protein
MTPSRDGLHRRHDPRVARCVVVLNSISRHHSDSRRDGAGRFLNHGLGRSLGTVSISSDQLRNLPNTPASPLAGSRPTPQPAPNPFLPQRTRKLSSGRA